MKRKPVTFEGARFEVVASMNGAGGVAQREMPFRVAVLGDFSGRESRGILETGDALARRRPREVDRDNLDRVLAAVGPSARVKLAGRRSPRVDLRFLELEDFHPDRIFDRLGVFRSLREARVALRNPEPVAPPPAAGQGTVPDAAALAAGDLLDRVLDESEGRPPGEGGEAGRTEWDAFLRDIVSPHLVPRDDPRKAERIAGVDAAAAETMRGILRAPGFQALEAAWRAVHFLVTRVETDARLTLHLVDVSKAELAADLGGTDDPRETGMFRMLSGGAPEIPSDAPWSVMAGMYVFERTPEDAELLGRIARIASHSGAPFLAAGSPGLLGAGSWESLPDPSAWKTPSPGGTAETAWKAFRAVPEAGYVGLALPRFLLRLPYGEGTDPVERFAFEEMPGEPLHEAYLWGNPAVVCACLLAQGFGRSGWGEGIGGGRELGGLPLHVFVRGGEQDALPCSEVVLTERAVEAMLDAGIMPLLSTRGADTVRLARFQSAADPPTRLAGRWEPGRFGGS